jgi:hypothetical protein
MARRRGLWGLGPTGVGTNPLAGGCASAPDRFCSAKVRLSRGQNDCDRPCVRRGPSPESMRLRAIWWGEPDGSGQDVWRPTAGRQRRPADGLAAGPLPLLVLCQALSFLLGGASGFEGLCNTAGGNSIVTGTTSCGVRVSLWTPGQMPNISRPFAASSGNLRLGFSVRESVPNDARVTMFLPAQREGFLLDYGGTTSIVPVVTAGGTEALQPAHGTGMPTFTVQTQMDGNVKIGELLTITFGSMGTPTLADAEAGYQFDFTYIRNPYANAGLPIANVQVSLLRANGSAWYTGYAPLPEIVTNNLTSSDIKFELINPAAGIQTDVAITFTTLGWIPTDGRIEIFFPPGFTLTMGSTVAIYQTNWGEENAVYVSSISETERKVTLVLAGSLGFPVSPIKPLDRASLQLTKIRNPFSGTTGTFKVRTFSGSNDLIDAGIDLPGIMVEKGRLRNVQVTISDNAARQIAVYTFNMGTTGTVPGNGKFRIIFPFGYYLYAPTLVGYNGLGKTGVPTLSYSGLTIIIQLGAPANSTEAVDATDGVSFTIGGIVNPGAGSTGSYIIQSTFFDVGKVIDEARVMIVGITTGMFPSRSVTLAENRAGQRNAISVSVGTAGFIPNNAQLRITLPSGFGPSLPTNTTVASSQCCGNGQCTNPCNITVLSIVGSVVTVRLPGDGTSNLALGAIINVTINNVRNLWAGPKDGFDLTLFLSDGVSAVMQAMDVDGPVIIPSHFWPNVSVMFSESPTLEGTFGAPLSGRCGAYRIRIYLNGILPEFATFKVTFPKGIQLNDVFCDFAEPQTKISVSRLTHFRIPLQYVLRTDAGERTVITQVATGGRSDSWTIPHFVEMYITNLRHMHAGSLEPFKIEALLPDTVSVVSQNLSIPVLPVIAMGSQIQDVLKTTAVPQSLNAGVRTTVNVNVETRGRLPRTSIVEVKLPSSFRINDGDNTRVLTSQLNRTEADMQVVYTDTPNGIVHVQIDTKMPTPANPDGLTNSTFICQVPGDYQTCVRTPPIVAPGALLAGFGDDQTLAGYVRGTFSFTISQIRNLAGGYSGDFEVNTYLADGSSLVEQNRNVPGSTLIIGALADGTVKPALLGSATRVTVEVMVSISNTLQANGNIIVTFPPGFDVDDGSPSNVTQATVIRFANEAETPARIVASDKAARSVTVGVGGSPDEFLAAFNKVKFTLTNVRNMVARPAPGATSELSGTFQLKTQLASGALVETISVPGVLISPNVIEPFPVGDGDVFLQSLFNGTGVSVKVQYSSDAVLPENSVIVLGFPKAYTFNVGGFSKATVTYDGVEDPRYVPLNLTASNLVGLTTQVRIQRVNGTSVVSPGVIIAVNISHVKVADQVFPTGPHNISVLTLDGASIATGLLPDAYIGRPSEPLDLVHENCKADWPAPDPRCTEVAWKPPLDNAGNPIIKYKIAFAVSSLRFDQIVQEIEVDADVGGQTLLGGLPLKVKSNKLAEGFIYYVRVQAGTMNRGIFGYGKRGFGNAVRAISFPGPPRATLLRSGTTNRLHAQWIQPQFTGALNPPVPIVNYKVEFSRFNNLFNALGPNDTAVADGSARALSSELLQPGRYYARVFAANLAGFGEPSVYSATALATPIVPVAWDDTVTPAEGSVQRIQVGYKLTIVIRAFDGDITDRVDVMVDSDQGKMFCQYWRLIPTDTGHMTSQA